MSVLSEGPLDPKYFGEGLTILNQKIYQLTWRERVVFIYDLDLELQKQVSMPSEIKEGWGLCNDGEYLYISEGSEKIYKVNPDTFEVISRISVSQGPSLVWNLNELEWVNGEIWANIYYSYYIVRIDPSTGNAIGWINLNGINCNETVNWDAGYVLNGIAVYNDLIYVTGKDWSNLYQIELIKDIKLSKSPV